MSAITMNIRELTAEFDARRRNVRSAHQHTVTAATAMRWLKLTGAATVAGVLLSLLVLI